MLLETHNKQVLLTMKQAYFMPSNNNNASGLSPFLIHGNKTVSHVMCESDNVEIDDSNNIKIPIALIRIVLDHIIIKIIPPSDSYDIKQLSKHKSECHIDALNDT